MPADTDCTEVLKIIGRFIANAPTSDTPHDWLFQETEDRCAGCLSVTEAGCLINSPCVLINDAGEVLPPSPPPSAEESL